MRRTHLVLSTALVLTGLLAAPAASQTRQAPPTSADRTAFIEGTGPLRIAYSGLGSRSFGVCTSNPDGTNNACISDGFRPVVGPAGAWVYFINHQDDSDSTPLGIYRVRADGSAFDVVREKWPYFSPGAARVDISADGKRLVYDRLSDNSPFATRDIYVSKGNGRQERQLTNIGGVGQPSFSPDASKVVFFGCPDGHDGSYGHICVVPTSGGTPQVIARGENPRWSRHGEIAFTNLDNGHIMLVDGDGSHLRDTGISGMHPALSPDGQMVTFTRYVEGGNVEQVWVANTNGTHVVRINDQGEDPVWYDGTTVPTGNAPSVTVEPPKSEIVGGQPVTFHWSVQGQADSISIVLEDEDPSWLRGHPGDPFNPDRVTRGFSLVSGLPGNTTSYTWTPPKSIQWVDRQVRVAAVDDQGQVGVGLSSYVTLRPAPGIPPYVRVAYPSDPGIDMHVGSQGWTSYVRSDPDGIVKLVARLSTDGGKTYPTVLNRYQGDTVILDFVVPDLPTTQAKIKVTAWDSLGNSSSDISDNVFTISEY
jgi:hypothetical protein